ncbi:MAG: LPS assembly protein LptD [Deltaproteobacteria bacterium]|jgi:LPS-assembly protein|nr:LPS assembly protein LptD [Deltaproteobacteria bacterium]
MPHIFRACYQAALRRAALALCLYLLPAFGLAVLPLALPGQVSAASNLTMSDEDDRDRIWTLNAESMVSLAGGDIMEAHGNVDLRMGDDYLKADFARYYTKTNWIYLSGNVEMNMGGDSLTAASAEFNLNSRTGWLTDGVIFISSSHTYFAGDYIIKHWGDIYTFRNAKVTACDGDAPAWSFTADSAVVELDGYAQLWGTSFQVVDTPIVYSPYLVLPAKKDRQTGFLMPEYGHSSEHGYFYNQPFFWAIDSSRDLTLNEYYMSRHGFMHGATYRSRGSEDEKLWLRFDWMDDRQRVTDLSDGEYSSDAYVRKNSQRWWLRGMYDWRLPDPNWRLRADLDFVSDQDYLREFTQGFSGFEATRTNLFEQFARDLQENDRNRQSGLLLFRDWQRGSVYMGAAYEQNPKYGNGNQLRSLDTTVQTLPQFGAFLHKGRIFENFPLEAQASADGAYKYRREGTKGMRFDVFPRLSLPMHSDYGSVIVSAGLSSTWYENTEQNHSGTGANERVKENANRLMSDVDVQASTDFSRVYDLDVSGSELSEAGDSRWVAVRHNITPRLSYRNVSAEDQRGNPYYDETDRASNLNQLVYSIENSFTRKQEKLLARTTPEGEEEFFTTVDYLKVFSLRLEQAYDIRESRRDYNLDDHDRRPFRDIMAEATFNYDRYLSFTTRTYWITESGSLDRHDHGVSLNIPEWGRLSTAMSFRGARRDYFVQRNKPISLVRFNGEFELFGPFSATFFYDWNIKGPGKEDKGLLITYNHECFKLIGDFSKDGDDVRVGLMVQLSGF